MAPEETLWDRTMKVYEALRVRDMKPVSSHMKAHYARMDALYVLPMRLVCSDVVCETTF